MLLTLLACHLFFLVIKLLAALFQTECAESLSCLDHVSIGKHCCVRNNEGVHGETSHVGLSLVTVECGG